MIATAATRVARFIALFALAAGILAGAALGLGGTAVGLSGTAQAATSTTHPEPRPGIVTEPRTKARPAPEAHPGSYWHRHRSFDLHTNS